jgi:hypothetical protein
MKAKGLLLTISALILAAIMTAAPLAVKETTHRA